MIFDSKYEVLLRTAYHYYCNVSQSEPCRMRLVNGADDKLSSPDERLSNARYLEKLGLLDTVSLDDNVLYCRLTQKGLEYCDPSAKQPPATFQIGSIGGNAIVGSQQNATINVGSSLAEIRSYIENASAIPVADKVQLHEFVDAIEKISTQNASISRGELKQHANLLERYGPIAGAIVGQLVGFLLGK